MQTPVLPHVRRPIDNGCSTLLLQPLSHFLLKPNKGKLIKSHIYFEQVHKRETVCYSSSTSTTSTTTIFFRFPHCRQTTLVCWKCKQLWYSYPTPLSTPKPSLTKFYRWKEREKRRWRGKKNLQSIYLDVFYFLLSQTIPLSPYPQCNLECAGFCVG